MVKNKIIMEKLFKYLDYVFVVSVFLNNKVERTLNGRRWHQITVCSEVGAEYYTRIDVLSSDLELSLSKIEIDIIKWVDKKEKRKLLTPDEKLLISLGFE